MNRFALFRDCLLFLAIGMAFGCCGCLVQPSTETVKLDDAATLLSSQAGNLEPASHNGNLAQLPELVEAVPVVRQAPEPSDRQELLKPVTASEPIYRPQTFETFKPATTPPATTPEKPGFTGALVYVAEECPPCHFLETDLRYLEAKYHWTLSRETDEKLTDWVITDRPSPSGQNPLIEFYRAGELIATAEGYDTRPSFTDRKESLRKLIAAHPVARKDIK